MCLSDAYEIKDGKQNLVCSRVCNVSADGENVTLTDLMGIRKICLLYTSPSPRDTR